MFSQRTGTANLKSLKPSSWFQHSGLNVRQMLDTMLACPDSTQLADMRVSESFTRVSCCMSPLGQSHNVCTFWAGRLHNPHLTFFGVWSINQSNLYGPVTLPWLAGSAMHRLQQELVLTQRQAGRHTARSAKDESALRMGKKESRWLPLIRSHQLTEGLLWQRDNKPSVSFSYFWLASATPTRK